MPLHNNVLNYKITQLCVESQAFHWDAHDSIFLLMNKIQMNRHEVVVDLRDVHLKSFIYIFGIYAEK